MLYIKLYCFTHLGVAFWIAADLGESSSSTFEQHVMKVFLSACLNISSCKVVRGSGITIFYIFKMLAGKANEALCCTNTLAPHKTNACPVSCIQLRAFDFTYTNQLYIISQVKERIERLSRMLEHCFKS